MNKDLSLSGDINGFIDKIFEISPKYQAIKIYNDEIKNDPNLSYIEKMAFILERRKILKQAENFAATLNLADLLLKEKGKSLENEIPNLNEDWLNYYFDVIENFSDNEMQSIWAKILAGECENKGSISKKLISIMQTIDLEMAEKFSFLCSHSLIVFDSKDNDKNIIPILPRLIKGEYVENKVIKDFISSIIIDTIDLYNLQIIGLITFDNTEFGYFCLPGNEADALYYKTKFHITSENDIPTGKVSYTKYGKELAWILHNDLIDQKDDNYIEFVKQYMKEMEPTIKFSN